MALWEKFKEELCEDVLHAWREEVNDSTLPLCVLIEHEVLRKLNVILADFASKKTVQHFGLPTPSAGDDFFGDYMHEVRAATVSDPEDQKALAAEAKAMCGAMTVEQHRVIIALWDVVDEDYWPEGQEPPNTAFFLAAPGDTGKTFVLNALIKTMRSHGWIVIAVASSGLAALLLPNGRTAHSRFKIPINVNATSRCFIEKRNDPVMELIKRTALIVWDEAPMQSRAVFETVDRTLRDIMDSDKIFGGIATLFCGDFQQILPVVPCASRTQIMAQCLTASHLWSDIALLHLTVNMRVHLRMASPSQTEDARKFNEFLSDIGHGTVPVHRDRGEDVVRIPDEYVSKCGTLQQFIEEVYPDLHEQISDKVYLSERAILATKNATVDAINAQMLEMYPGEISPPFLSADSVSAEDDPLMVPDDLLNSLTPSGLPPHKLFLKLQAPIILLRNIDPSKGACNGTRLTITQLTPHVIEAEIITGQHAGETIYIPRCVILQFHVRLAFAMTVNKSQGQTFQKVGVYLPKAMFTHGQLYVALSRVGAPKDVSLFIENTDDAGHCMQTEEGTFTKNIVFQEVFSS